MSDPSRIAQTRAAITAIEALAAYAQRLEEQVHTYKRLAGVAIYGGRIDHRLKCGDGPHCYHKKRVCCRCDHIAPGRTDA